MHSLFFRLGAAPCLVLLSLVPRVAQACSGGGPQPTLVVPAAGSGTVSTASSIKVIGSDTGQVELRAGGQLVALQTPQLLGPSHMGGTARLFSPVDLLLPGTAYTVSVTPVSGESPVVSTFTTGSGYDKEPGTLPAIESLRLWRARYPITDIGAGGCVASEYVGFIEVRWKGAILPGTTPAETLHTFSLTPRHGGPEQRLVVLGPDTKLGAEPLGDYPFPLQGWNPTLDPTQEYCVTVSALGNGDKARPPSVSQTVCTCVEQRSVHGAPPSPQVEGACPASTGAVGGAGGESGAGAGGEAGAAGSEAGGASGSTSGSSGQSDAGTSQGGAGSPAASGQNSVDTPDPGSGCATRGASTPASRWPGAALALAVLARARRRARAR